MLYVSFLAIPLPWHDNAHAEPYNDLWEKEKGVYILILSAELLITFVCVGSPLVAYRIYYRTQGITTQRLTNRARIGAMVLAFIALIAVLSLVLFTIHPPSSKFAVPFFYGLFLVSSFIFHWTSPIPPPPG